MRIAFLTPEYVTEPNFDGGLANYLHRVARGMKQFGHEVEVFTLSASDGVIVHDGVHVNRVRIDERMLGRCNRLTRTRFPMTLRALFAAFHLSRRFRERHRAAPFDILQASNEWASGLFVRRDKSICLVTRVSFYQPLWRESYRQPLTLDRRIFEWLYGVAERRSDAVCVPSEFMARIWREKTACQADVIRPPFFLEADTVDETVYQKHLAGKKYFLFFGAIGVLKGGDVLGKAVAPLLSRIPDLFLVLVGRDVQGPAGGSMVEFIKQEAGIHQDRILHLGVLSHAQLYPIIRRSWSVVLPSICDNLPNAMLEAMALGAAVIGTKGTSFEEFIDDGVSGWLVEPGNVEALSNTMQTVWSLPAERIESIGSRAQEALSPLAPQTACARTQEYFQDVMRRFRSSGVVHGNKLSHAAEDPVSEPGARV